MNAILQGGAQPQPDQHQRWQRIPAELRQRPQWVLATPGDKRPRTPSGHAASSTAPGTWTDFDTACAAAALRGWQIGYVLTDSDPFTCVDLDVKTQASHPKEPGSWTTPEQLERHDAIVATLASYTERSRSGLGRHVWVRAELGRGCKRDGVELYSRERFIICTGDVVHDLPIGDRQDFVANMASRMRPQVLPDAELRPDEPGDDLGCCIAAFAIEDSGEMGRLMRGDWHGQDDTGGRKYPSQSEADFALLLMLGRLTESNGACREAFRRSLLGERDKAQQDDRYLNLTLRKVRAILADEAFHVAQGSRIMGELFWPEPTWKPSVDCADPSDDVHSFTLEFAMSTDTATLTLEYLLDPWLPLRCVVGFFGRGSTAKSSFLASTAAAISGFASTLWISVEEPDDWIKVRHIRCGGADKTLAVVKAIESKRDREGRVVASSFNVLTDLEAAIEQAKAAFAAQQRPPLRLVVLDTAVGLTNWGKGESPNDDAAVKKLLAHLQAWAEKHELTIAIIGHANKGTHDHLADSVMGAAAWTNSPRLSFIHAADRREDHTYVVRTAKTNFEAFGAAYRTEAVHTLYERQGGPDTVLVRVVPEPIVWGSVDSMEMFKEATKVPTPDSDGDGPAPSTPKVPEVVLGNLIEAIMTVPVGECVTREQVEQRYGKQVDRARWQKVELQLTGHPAVKVERGDKNKALYRRTL